MSGAGSCRDNLDTWLDNLPEDEHERPAPEGGEWCRVSITVSLDEAETIAYVLSDADEDHLAEHVKYCIQEAKQKAGYLQSKGKTQI